MQLGSSDEEAADGSELSTLKVINSHMDDSKNVPDEQVSTLWLVDLSSR